MLNSTILDLAIGLVFTFLAMSLAVSAIVETVASAMSWRAATLLQGMKDLLNDQTFKGLALDVYNHPLVSPRDSGTATTETDLKNLPAYVQPGQFADALMDTLKISADSAENMKKNISGRVADGQLKGLLNGLVDRSGGDLTKIRAGIAEWFDNGMDRLSGVYKRRTQVWSFVLAFLIAAAMNVSVINVGRELWLRPMLARTIGATPDVKPLDAFKQLETLGVPIGWTTERLQNLQGLTILELFLGWLVTAAATLFGAPFWYDALEKIVRVKGTGPSPADKRSGTSAAN
jgi:hypothetical protein